MAWIVSATPAIVLVSLRYAVCFTMAAGSFCWMFPLFVHAFARPAKRWNARSTLIIGNGESTDLLSLTGDSVSGNLSDIIRYPNRYTRTTCLVYVIDVVLSGHECSNRGKIRITSHPATHFMKYGHVVGLFLTWVVRLEHP